MGKAAVATKPGAAGGSGAGMDKTELKRLLRPAHDEPVSAAFALGADGKAILVLDKRKQAQALAKQLRDEAPDSKNHRWGSVSISPDDPKLARFTVNKASSGMSRKLVLALKGTGYSKVEIVLEDGTAVEAHDEPEEQAQDGEADAGGAQPGEARHAAGAPAAASDSNGAAAVAAKPDAKGLTQELTGLIHRMLEAIRHDPSQKAALAELATDAQASLKRGDLDQAAAGIEVLRQAIESLAPAGGAGAGVDGHNGAPHAAPKPDGAANGAGAATGHAGNGHAGQAHASQGHPDTASLEKAHAAWLATHKRLESELDKVRRAVLEAFEEHDAADDLASAFQEQIGPVLHNLDEGLAHALGDLARNPDPAKHAALVQHAHRIIDRHRAYIASEPLIGALDENPFAPVAIAKTLESALNALSRAVR